MGAMYGKGLALARLTLFSGRGLRSTSLLCHASTACCVILLLAGPCASAFAQGAEVRVAAQELQQREGLEGQHGAAQITQPRPPHVHPVSSQHAVAVTLPQLIAALMLAMLIGGVGSLGLMRGWFGPAAFKGAGRSGACPQDQGPMRPLQQPPAFTTGEMHQAQLPNERFEGFQIPCPGAVDNGTPLPSCQGGWPMQQVCHAAAVGPEHVIGATTPAHCGARTLPAPKADGEWHQPVQQLSPQRISCFPASPSPCASAGHDTDEMVGSVHMLAHHPPTHSGQLGPPQPCAATLLHCTDTVPTAIGVLRDTAFGQPPLNKLPAAAAAEAAGDAGGSCCSRQLSRDISLDVQQHHGRVHVTSMLLGTDSRSMASSHTLPSSPPTSTTTLAYNSVSSFGRSSFGRSSKDVHQPPAPSASLFTLPVHSSHTAGMEATTPTATATSSPRPMLQIDLQTLLSPAPTAQLTGTLPSGRSVPHSPLMLPRKPPRHSVLYVSRTRRAVYSVKLNEPPAAVEDLAATMNRHAAELLLGTATDASPASIAHVAAVCVRGCIQLLAWCTSLAHAVSDDPAIPGGGTGMRLHAACVKEQLLADVLHQASSAGVLLGTHAGQTIMRASIHAQPGGSAWSNATGDFAVGAVGAEQAAGAGTVWVSPQCITQGSTVEVVVVVRLDDMVDGSAALDARVLLMLGQLTLVDVHVSLPPEAPDGTRTLRFNIPFTPTCGSATLDCQVQPLQLFMVTVTQPGAHEAASDASPAIDGRLLASAMILMGPAQLTEEVGRLSAAMLQEILSASAPAGDEPATAATVDAAVQMEQVWMHSLHPFLCDLCFLLQTSQQLPAAITAAATSRHAHDQLATWVGLAQEVVAYMLQHRMVWSCTMVTELLVHTGVTITSGTQQVLGGQVAAVLERALAPDAPQPGADAVTHTSSGIIATAALRTTVPGDLRVMSTHAHGSSASSVEFIDAAWELEAMVNSGSAARTLQHSEAMHTNWSEHAAAMLQGVLHHKQSAFQESGGLLAVAIGTVVALGLSQIVRFVRSVLQMGMICLSQHLLVIGVLLLLAAAANWALSGSRNNSVHAPESDAPAQPELMVASGHATSEINMSPEAGAPMPTHASTTPASPTAVAHPLPQRMYSASPAPPRPDASSCADIVYLPGTPKPTPHLGPQDCNPHGQNMAPDSAGGRELGGAHMAAGTKSPTIPEPPTPDVSARRPPGRQTSSSAVRRSLFDAVGQAPAPTEQHLAGKPAAAARSPPRKLLAPRVCGELASIEEGAGEGAAGVAEVVAGPGRHQIQQAGAIAPLPGVQEFRCAVVVRDAQMLPTDACSVSIKEAAVALIHATAPQQTSLSQRTHNPVAPHPVELGSQQQQQQRQQQLSEPLPRLVLRQPQLGTQEPPAQPPLGIYSALLAAAPAGFRDTFSIFAAAQSEAAASFAPPRSPATSLAHASPATTAHSNSRGSLPGSAAMSSMSDAVQHGRHGDGDGDAGDGLLLCTTADGEEAVATPAAAAAAATPQLQAPHRDPRRAPSMRRSLSFHLAIHARWKEFLARAADPVQAVPASGAAPQLLLPDSPAQTPLQQGGNADMPVRLSPAGSARPASPALPPIHTLEGPPVHAAAHLGSVRDLTPADSGADVVVSTMSATPSALPGWHEVHCALLVRDPHVRALTARGVGGSASAAAPGVPPSLAAAHVGAWVAQAQAPSELSTCTESLLSSMPEVSGHTSSPELHLNELNELECGLITGSARHTPHGLDFTGSEPGTGNLLRSDSTAQIPEQLAAAGYHELDLEILVRPAMMHAVECSAFARTSANSQLSTLSTSTLASSMSVMAPLPHTHAHPAASGDAGTGVCAHSAPGHQPQLGGGTQGALEVHFDGAGRNGNVSALAGSTAAGAVPLPKGFVHTRASPSCPTSVVSLLSRPSNSRPHPLSSIGDIHSMLSSSVLLHAATSPGPLTGSQHTGSTHGTEASHGTSVDEGSAGWLLSSLRHEVTGSGSALLSVPRTHGGSVAPDSPGTGSNVHVGNEGAGAEAWSAPPRGGATQQASVECLMGVLGCTESGIGRAQGGPLGSGLHALLRAQCTSAHSGSLSVAGPGSMAGSSVAADVGIHKPDDPCCGSTCDDNSRASVVTLGGGTQRFGRAVEPGTGVGGSDEVMLPHLSNARIATGTYSDDVAHAPENAATGQAFLLHCSASDSLFFEAAQTPFGPQDQEQALNGGTHTHAADVGLGAPWSPGSGVQDLLPSRQLAAPPSPVWGTGTMVPSLGWGKGWLQPAGHEAHEEAGARQGMGAGTHASDASPPAGSTAAWHLPMGCSEPLPGLHFSSTCPTAHGMQALSTMTSTNSPVSHLTSDAAGAGGKCLQAHPHHTDAGNTHSLLITGHTQLPAAPRHASPAGSKRKAPAPALPRPPSSVLLLPPEEPLDITTLIGAGLDWSGDDDALALDASGADSLHPYPPQHSLLLNTTPPASPLRRCAGRVHTPQPSPGRALSVPLYHQHQLGQQPHASPVRSQSLFTPHQPTTAQLSQLPPPSPRGDFVAHARTAAAKGAAPPPSPGRHAVALPPSPLMRQEMLRSSRQALSPSTADLTSLSGSLLSEPNALLPGWPLNTGHVLGPPPPSPGRMGVRGPLSSAVGLPLGAGSSPGHALPGFPHEAGDEAGSGGGGVLDLDEMLRRCKSGAPPTDGEVTGLVMSTGLGLLGHEYAVPPQRAFPPRTPRGGTTTMDSVRMAAGLVGPPPPSPTCFSHFSASSISSHGPVAAARVHISQPTPEAPTSTLCGATAGAGTTLMAAMGVQHQPAHEALRHPMAIAHTAQQWVGEGPPGSGFAQDPPTPTLLHHASVFPADCTGTGSCGSMAAAGVAQLQPLTRFRGTPSPETVSTPTSGSRTSDIEAQGSSLYRELSLVQGGLSPSPPYDAQHSLLMAETPPLACATAAAAAVFPTTTPTSSSSGPNTPVLSRRSLPTGKNRQHLHDKSLKSGCGRARTSPQQEYHQLQTLAGPTTLADNPFELAAHELSQGGDAHAAPPHTTMSPLPFMLQLHTHTRPSSCGTKVGSSASAITSGCAGSSPPVQPTGPSLSAGRHPACGYISEDMPFLPPSPWQGARFLLPPDPGSVGADGGYRGVRGALSSSAHMQQPQLSFGVTGGTQVLAGGGADEWGVPCIDLDDLMGEDEAAHSVCALSRLFEDASSEPGTGASSVGHLATQCTYTCDNSFDAGAASGSPFRSANVDEHGMAGVSAGCASRQMNESSPPTRVMPSACDLQPKSTSFSMSTSLSERASSEVESLLLGTLDAWNIQSPALASSGGLGDGGSSSATNAFSVTSFGMSASLASGPLTEAPGAKPTPGAATDTPRAHCAPASAGSPVTSRHAPVVLQAPVCVRDHTAAPVLFSTGQCSPAARRLGLAGAGAGHGSPSRRDSTHHGSGNVLSGARRLPRRNQSSRALQRSPLSTITEGVVHSPGRARRASSAQLPPLDVFHVGPTSAVSKGTGVGGSSGSSGGSSVATYRQSLGEGGHAHATDSLGQLAGPAGCDLPEAPVLLEYQEVMCRLLVRSACLSSAHIQTHHGGTRSAASTTPFPSAATDNRLPRGAHTTHDLTLNPPPQLLPLLLGVRPTHAGRGSSSSSSSISPNSSCGVVASPHSHINTEEGSAYGSTRAAHGQGESQQMPVQAAHGGPQDVVPAGGGSEGGVVLAARYQRVRWTLLVRRVDDEPSSV